MPFNVNLKKEKEKQYIGYFAWRSCSSVQRVRAVCSSIARMCTVTCKLNRHDRRCPYDIIHVC